MGLKLAGVMVILMSPVAIVSNRFDVSEKRESWLNPCVGGAMGVIGGTTVIFTPALVYLAALRIDKDSYVTAVALAAAQATHAQFPAALPTPTELERCFFEG